jgi:hypothetical protein
MDVFIYTDNNDFFYNDVQYFSDKNQQKTLGVNQENYRFHSNHEYISYEKANEMLMTIFRETFGDRQKNTIIEDYDPKLIEKIYDKDNANHKAFMETQEGESWKIGIMCQWYKVYKCYELIKEYENENNFEYDVIFRTRFDNLFFNFHNEVDLNMLDYEKTIYCPNLQWHVNDYWAIGNRFIMDKYCSYFKNISQVLIECVYLFLYHDSGGNVSYWKETKNKEDKHFYENYITGVWDVTASSEYGLTYLIKQNNYKITSVNMCATIITRYD